MRAWSVLPAALACAVWAGWASAQPATDEEIQELFAPSPAPAQAGPGRSGRTDITGLSNQFNPSIGIAGLLLGAAGDDGPAEFGIQEIEFVISSAIDPFFRLDIFLAVEEEFDAAGLGHGEEEEEGGGEEPTVILEQAYVTATSLPGMTLRFGKFTLPFGKHNIMHRDQFPFVTAPAVNRETFGGEGLNETAIEATPLLPLPFFAELNLVAFEGANEGLLRFAEDSGGSEKAAYLVHDKNLFDVTEDSTIEFGLSYLSGANNAGSGRTTTAAGADITFKQRPVTGRGLGGVRLQAEYIGATREAEENLESSGYYVSAQWRVLPYWWVQGRYGEAGIDEIGDVGIEREETQHTDYLLAWVISEFSVLRLQYSQYESGGDTESAWYLQFNFAAGAHPAHQY
jgi:hypothetical protein